MKKLVKMCVWASCVACLAIGVATSGAFAQQQEEQDQARQQQDEQQEEAREHEVQRQNYDQDESETQRADRQRQRSQQEQQRAQQQRQRSQQEQQRAQQQRGRDQQARDRDRFPSPQRDRQRFDRDEQQYSRQQQYGRDQYSTQDQQYTRQTQRSGQRDQDAGLGVFITHDQEGVRVTQVQPDSPAEDMGLREGDIITHLDGEEVRSVQQFVSNVRQKDPGEEIEIDIQRGQEEENLSGELVSRREALVLQGQQRQQGWDQQQRWGQQDRQFGQQQRYGQQRGSWDQQDRDTWQTGYQEGGSSQARTRSQQGQRVDPQQIDQIEQHVQRLSREIENLRFALQDLRQQSGRSGETTARYDEYDRAERMGTRQQWDDRQFDGEYQYDGQRGQQMRGQQMRGQQQFDRSGQRQFDQSGTETSGGVIGEDRTRPGTGAGHSGSGRN